jgi:uncharacterized protein (TIGR02246 family)
VRPAVGFRSALEFGGGVGAKDAHRIGIVEDERMGVDKLVRSAAECDAQGGPGWGGFVQEGQPFTTCGAGLAMPQRIKMAQRLPGRGATLRGLGRRRQIAGKAVGWTRQEGRTMAKDESEEIRAVVRDWLEASKRNDLEQVLALTSPEVLFHVPGHEPFGRDFFEEVSRTQGDVGLEGSVETLEVEVMGDLAYARNHLQLRFTGPDGTTSERAGYTLSLYKRNEAGQWQLWRDANLMGADKLEK